MDTWALSKVTGIPIGEHLAKPFASATLPVVPELYRGVKKFFTITFGPRSMRVVPQQVVLLIRANKLAFIGFFLNPIDAIHKAVLIIRSEFLTRDVVKKAFDIVGGGLSCG